MYTRNKAVLQVMTILNEVVSKIKLKNQLKGEVIEKTFSIIKEMHEQKEHALKDASAKLYRNHSVTLSIIADLRHEYDDIAMKMKYFLTFLESRNTEESIAIKQYFTESMKNLLYGELRSIDPPSFNHLGQELDSMLSSSLPQIEPSKTINIKQSVIKSTLVDLYDDMLKQKTVLNFIRNCLRLILESLNPIFQ